MRIYKLIATIVLLSWTPSAAGQTTPLRVLVSNGMKAVVEELRPRLEREVGRPLAIQFNTSAAIRQRIESGEAFDAAILTTEVINDLSKAGKITAASIRDLGRSGIGFGVRLGTAKPDVATLEAVKTTLLNTKSMTWVSVGASRAHIERMIDGLGISPQVKSKIQLTRGVDESLAMVVNGKTEMIITLISEILPAKGIQLVGPLPPKFQSYVSFAAGVSPGSSAAAASAQLIRILGETSAARVYESKGMELPVQRDPPRRPVK